MWSGRPARVEVVLGQHLEEADAPGAARGCGCSGRSAARRRDPGQGTPSGLRVSRGHRFPPGRAGAAAAPAFSAPTLTLRPSRALRSRPCPCTSSCRRSRCRRSCSRPCSCRSSRPCTRAGLGGGATALALARVLSRAAVVAGLAVPLALARVHPLARVLVGRLRLVARRRGRLAATPALAAAPVGDDPVLGHRRARPDRREHTEPRHQPRHRRVDQHPLRSVAHSPSPFLRV